MLVGIVLVSFIIVTTHFKDCLSVCAFLSLSTHTSVLLLVISHTLTERDILFHGSKFNTALSSSTVPAEKEQAYHQTDKEQNKRS